MQQECVKGLGSYKACSANFAMTEFYEVELLISRFLGSCARFCNPSYLLSLINSRRGRWVSPSLKRLV